MNFNFIKYDILPNNNSYTQYLLPVAIVPAAFGLWHIPAPGSLSDAG